MGSILSGLLAVKQASQSDKLADELPRRPDAQGIGGNPYLSSFCSICKMVDNQMTWIAEVNKLLQCRRIWIHRIWIQITARCSNGRFHKIRSTFNSRLCDVSSRHRGGNSKTNL